MRIELNFVDQSVGASKAAIEGPEIDKEVLHFGTEPTYYSSFESAAGCPTYFGFSFTSKIRNLRADPPIGRASRDVRENSVDRITYATASGGKPLTSCPTGKIWIGAGIAATNIGPVHISFNTQEKPTCL